MPCGSFRSTRTDAAPRVVRCFSATADLSSPRRRFGQEAIRDCLQLPVDGPRLAKRLTALSHLAWLGGALDVAGDVCADLVQYLSDSRGSWAALLEPHGPRHVGHWVVVDGLSPDGLVLVRDPDGDAYGTPVEEFLTLWHYAVLVLEEAR